MKKRSSPVSTKRRAEAYDLLGRELRARARALPDFTRKDIAEAGQIEPDTMMTIFAGRRPLPADSIPRLAKTLVLRGEDVTALERTLAVLNQQAASRKAFARGLEEKLRVGFVNWPPFVSTDATGGEIPRGLVPDLLQLLFRLMGVRADRIEWREVLFAELNPTIESNEFDVVAGFVLETARRRARAQFVPLDFPIRVGVNAITRSPLFSERMRFDAFLNQLRTGLTSNDPLNLVLVQSDIADEYFEALFPGIARPRSLDRRSILQAIEDAMQYEHTVVLADQFSCSQAAAADVTRSRHVVLEHAIGEFRGGFFLPADDPEWTEFFDGSVQQMFRAKLPALSRIISSYSAELSRLITETIDVSADADFRRFSELREWVRKYWSPHVDLPSFWSERLGQANLSRQSD